MGNLTSSRPWLFRRPRLLAISAVVGVVAILVLAGTLTLGALNLHNVHASGTGGGDCYGTTGPVCTFKGHNANAQFESTSGCVISDVYLFVSDNFTRSGATTSSSSYIYLNTYSYNTCTGDSSFGWGYDTGTVQISSSSYIYLNTYNYNTCTGDFSFGWGNDTGTVQISSSGDSLNAQGNIVVYMCTSSGGGTSAGTLGGSGTGGGCGTSSTTTYTLNVTWKSFGQPSRQVSDSHYQSPGYITNMHFTGTSQNALVSGTLSDGTTNFLATPSVFGEWIGADSGTFITIQK